MKHSCPNLSCESPDIIKKGYYKTKHNHQPVPRYLCKSCHTCFSSHTNSETFRQHKPEVNSEIFKLLVSGVTMRRAAIIVGVAKKTIERKFKFLAEKAKKLHEEHLKTIKTSYVHFDEMESCEQSKLKPLSIALAVRAKTGEIIDIDVAEMNCKGKLASTSQAKYGLRKDERKQACESVMKTVKIVAKDNITIASDGKKYYPSIVNKIIPHAQVSQYVSRVSKRKQHDPLFSLNHTCAKIRADISRMARKTWAISKKAENLKKHLYLYIVWNNEYLI